MDIFLMQLFDQWKRLEDEFKILRHNTISTHILTNDLYVELGNEYWTPWNKDEIARFTNRVISGI